MKELNLSELRENLKLKGISDSTITKIIDTLAELGVIETAPPAEPPFQLPFTEEEIENGDPELLK